MNDVKQNIIVLKDGVGEIVKALDRIQAEREYIKETVESVSEKTEVPKKYIRRMGKLIQQAQVATHRSEMDEFGELLDSVVGTMIS